MSGVSAVGTVSLCPPGGNQIGRNTTEPRFVDVLRIRVRRDRSHGSDHVFNQLGNNIVHVHDHPTIETRKP